jgi:hypothetical protein
MISTGCEAVAPTAQPTPSCSECARRSARCVSRAILASGPVALKSLATLHPGKMHGAGGTSLNHFLNPTSDSKPHYLNVGNGRSRATLHTSIDQLIGYQVLASVIDHGSVGLRRPWCWPGASPKPLRCSGRCRRSSGSWGRVLASHGCHRPTLRDCPRDHTQPDDLTSRMSNSGLIRAM